VADEQRQAHVIYRAVLLAGALIVLGLLFRQLLTLLLAVLITIVIAIPLSAFATWLERQGLPRQLGALLGVLAGLGAIAGVLMLVIPPFVEEMNDFVDSVPGIVDDLERQAADITGAEPREVGDTVQEFFQRYTDKPERLVGPITSIGLNVAGILGALIVMIITAYFMAVRPQPLVDGALRLFPPARRPWALAVMRRLRAAWIGWLKGVLIDMTLTGTLLYVGLTIIDVDFAIVFAVLAALLVVIPYYGAFIGALPPLLFALADSPGKALLVLIVYVAVQQFESNVTIPVIMARAVRLHPAVIAIGVVVVGQLFGVIGLFVAVPILSLVVILTDELWVKPMEEAHERRALEGEEPPPSPLEPVLPSGGEEPVGAEAPR
jgi:predicted PurR-regulated permease PerM